MLCASSANTFNQVFEVKNDSLMRRTMKRPLPSGRASVAHAIAFGGDGRCKLTHPGLKAPGFKRSLIVKSVTVLSF